MKQVRSSVVLFRGQPSRHIHFRLHLVPNLQGASETFRVMCRVTGDQRISVVNQRFGVLTFQRSRVANLTTRFGIEGSLVEKDLSSFASLQLLNWLPLRVNR